MALSITRNPCIACGWRQTIGVAYGSPREVKYWCANCLPYAFRSPVRDRSPQDMLDAWNEIEQDRDRKRWAEEDKLREDDNG